MSKYYDLDNTAEDINAILSNLIDVVVEDNDGTILGVESEDDETKIVAKDYGYVGEINGDKYQFVACDGEQWIEPAYWGYSTIGSIPAGSPGTYHTEYRFGPIFSTDVAAFGTTYTATAAVITNHLDIAKEIGASNAQMNIDVADENYYKLKIVDTAKASFSGASRFTIADDAEFDITNSASYSRSNPQIYIHDDVRVNLDNGTGTYASQYGGGVLRSSTSSNSDFSGVRLIMHDLANLQMDGRSYLLMHGSGTLSIGGNSYLQVNDGARAAFMGDSNIEFKEYSYLSMDDSSYFSMSCDSTTAATNYGPTFRLGGGCGIIMNGSNNDDTVSSTDLSGTFPLLLMSPNEFIYSGDGIYAHTNGRTAPAGTSMTGLMSAFSNVSLITYKPQIKIGGSSTILMDTGTNGKNHFKVGACSNGLVEVQLLDDTHTEMRQNSIFSLRGKHQTTHPWQDYEYDSPTTGASSGGGSMLTMYDQSILNLRGLYKDKSFSSVDSLPTSGTSTYPIYRIDNDYYIAGTIEASEDEDGVYNYSNWKVIWSPSRERVSGSPLIEAIDNAEVRFSDYSLINMSDTDITLTNNKTFKLAINDDGIAISSNNLKFSLDENGITFTDNNGTVTFTTTELETLKNLL